MLAEANSGRCSCRGVCSLDRDFVKDHMIHPSKRVWSTIWLFRIFVGAIVWLFCSEGYKFKVLEGPRRQLDRTWVYGPQFPGLSDA